MSDQHTPSSTPSTTEESLRQAAQERVQRKKTFWASLYGFLGLWALCWLVWALTGRASNPVPWPLWMAFWGLAVAMHGVHAFSRSSGPATEAEIQREMERLQAR